MTALPNPEPPRLRWPKFLLAAVVAGVLLAILWVSVEVKRVQQFQKFDYRPNSNQHNVAPTFDAEMSGGDPVTGRDIFFNKPEASCGRCHRVGNQGGDNGPALDDIGTRLSREQLLESMVKPNASIAKGYETVVVVLTNGLGLSGVLRAEDESSLTLHTPDDGERTVAKADIVRRAQGVSPMPDNFATLVRAEDLGHLVAFLATLTNAPATR